MHDVEITMTSIPDQSRRWGCSKNFLWERCKSGEIPATKIGDRWFIPIWWVKEQEQKAVLTRGKKMSWIEEQNEKEHVAK